MSHDLLFHAWDTLPLNSSTFRPICREPFISFYFVSSATDLSDGETFGVFVFGDFLLRLRRVFPADHENFGFGLSFELSFTLSLSLSFSLFWFHCLPTTPSYDSSVSFIFLSISVLFASVDLIFQPSLSASVIFFFFLGFTCPSFLQL